MDHICLDVKHMFSFNKKKQLGIEGHVKNVKEK